MTMIYGIVVNLAPSDRLTPVPNFVCLLCLVVL